MDVLMKASGLLLLSSCAAMLMRRSVPELSFALSALSVCTALCFAAVLARSVGELRQSARSFYGAGDVYMLPVLKCAACAVVSKITADVCRESSQTAAASAIELIGALCAMSAAMPLVRSMLETIGGLL